MIQKKLASSSSMKISLEAIRNGEAGLNEHRKNLLLRVPLPDDWSAFSTNSISIKDITYLSAATGHEFALLRGKNNDIIVHGVDRHCNFDKELLDLLKTKKLRLVAHTHPDYGITVPSKDDREFLKYIDQHTSIVISYITGNEIQFSANAFDDL